MISGNDISAHGRKKYNQHYRKPSHYKGIFKGPVKIYLLCRIMKVIGKNPGRKSKRIARSFHRRLKSVHYHNIKGKQIKKHHND